MSRRWLRFGVKLQVSGLDLAGYSTAKLIRSEGSVTRLKSQTKLKTENPPMCCCVADATTTEHKFLKLHNEKFERLSTSVGQVRESLETLRRAFRPRPTSMIVRSIPRATESKRKPATSSSKTDLFPGTVRYYGERSSSSRRRLFA
jgi:hypothetical protein